MKYLVLVWSILVLSGCGAGSHTINLSYQPNNISHCSQLSVPPKLALTVNVGRASTGDSLVLGRAVTGLLNSPVPTVGKVPLEIFFWNSASQAFQSLGVEVVDGRSAANFWLEILVSKFWVNEFVPGTALEYAEATIEATVTLHGRDRGFVLWQNSQQVHVQTPQNLMDATSELERVANEAIDELMRRIFTNAELCEVIANNSNSHYLPSMDHSTAAPEQMPGVLDDELILD